MTLPTPLENPNGITVKQLREWLALMPDVEPVDGEEPTIWIDADGLSNQVVSVYPSGVGDVFLEIRHDPPTN